MAWFGKKKDEDKDAKPPVAGNGSGNGSGEAKIATGAEDGDGKDDDKIVYSPEKAAKWFERAQAVHDSTNYEYAMQCWLSGLRLEPGNMKGLESFFKSAAAFLGDGKPPTKDTLRMFGGRPDIEKYLSALLAWALKPLDALLAVRAAEAAAKLNITEPTYWIGERALGAIATEKKPRKELFLKMMEVFSNIQAFNLAVVSGEAAVKLDPSDGRLAAEVRNLSAQATMNKGGFDQTGQAGGFRANIRDAEKQRQLDEQGRIVKTEETLDRVVRLAEDDYRARPDDPPANDTYIRRLLERGRPEDLKRAREVAKRAYEITKQFRFRQFEGDITLRLASRKLQDFRDAAEKNKDSQVAQQRYAEAQRQFAKMELDEFKARVEAYPTDLNLKFELARRYFNLGDMDNSIPLFQQSQEDAKRRVESQLYLAQAFQKIDYIDESIHTYRTAMEAHKLTNDDMGMNLRYGLLTSLQAKAEKDRDLPSAEEADKLASAISTQQFNYKDIRTRRDALKKLIADLKRGDPAPSA